MRIILVLITIVVLQALKSEAQYLYFEQVLPLPPAPQIIAEFDGVSNGDIGFVDIEGDLDQDILITGIDNSLDPIAKLYRNDGLGNYLEVIGTPFIGVSKSSIAFSDVDNDNDQDILISGRTKSSGIITKLYYNDGDGNFIDSTTSLMGMEDGKVCFLDVEKDGDDDLIIMGKGENGFNNAKLYRNDGYGSFTEDEAPLFENSYGHEFDFADIDNDTDYDIIITDLYNSYNAKSKLFLNDGNGRFTEVENTPFINVVQGSVVFGDVDNDADPDIILSGLNSGTGVTNLYQNDGNGSFLEVTDFPFEDLYYGSVNLEDIDNDNDLDVLLTGENHNGENTIKLYENDGNGDFDELPTTNFTPVGKGNVIFSDVDNDNDVDVVIAGRSSGAITDLYLNSGSGNFTKVTGSPFEELYRVTVAFTDVDNDGDLDILYGGYDVTFQDKCKIYYNNGHGVFDEISDVFLGDYFYFEVADVDNDNDPDIIATSSIGAGSQIAKLFINDGSGTFLEKENSTFFGVGYPIAFSDVDNDGDLDVAFAGAYNPNHANSITPVRLFINDGHGDFTQNTEVPFDKTIYTRFAFADVDNDSDQDILITGRNLDVGSIVKLYKNDGFGNYVEDQSSALEAVTDGGIIFGDVDNDNDQDVLINGSSSSSSRSISLYENDGTGEFNRIDDIPFDGMNTLNTKFVDINSDNYLDVFIAGHNNDGLKIAKFYINQGNGEFKEIYNTSIDGISSGDVAFADVDKDNDQDVLISGFGSSGGVFTKLYMNTTMVGIDENQNENSLKIWPNPTSGKAIIEFAEEIEDIQIYVRDVLGRIVNQGAFRSIQEINLEINGDSGIYFVELIFANRRDVVKVLKY